MMKKYLVSLIGIGLIGASMVVSADTWRYNPDTDLIDYTGNFSTVPDSQPDVFSLGKLPWAYDEATDTIVYRSNHTHLIPAAAYIGSRRVDRERLYREAEDTFLDQ